MKKRIACLVFMLMSILTLQLGDGVYAKSSKDPGTVNVKGYTKADGTQVKGYTPKKADPSVVHVKGYTKADGTVVKGYTRKKTSKNK